MLDLVGNPEDRFSHKRACSKGMKYPHGDSFLVQYRYTVKYALVES